MLTPRVGQEVNGKFSRTLVSDQNGQSIMRGYPSDNQTRLGQQKHLAGTGGHPNSGKTLGSVVRLAAWLCLSMTLSGVFTLAETAYSPIPRDPSSGLIKQQAPWFQIMARALQTQEPTRGMLENSIERTLAEIELPNNTLSNHIVNDPLVPYDQFPVGPLDEIHQTYHTIEDVVEHELGLDETIKPEYSRVQIVLPQHGVIQESENSWGETEESAGSSHNWANEDAVSLNKRFQMDLFQQPSCYGLGVRCDPRAPSRTKCHGWCTRAPSKTKKMCGLMKGRGFICVQRRVR